MERLIGSIDPSNPYSHPEASVLDSMTIATFLQKYSWTASECIYPQPKLAPLLGNGGYNCTERWKNEENRCMRDDEVQDRCFGG